MSFNCQKDLSIEIAASGGFWNTQQSYTAQCVLPLVGPDVTVVKAAHLFHSDVSQAAADALALSAATSEAEGTKVCCATPTEIGSLVWTETDNLNNGAVATMTFAGGSGTFDVNANWPGFGPIPGANVVMEVHFCSPWPTYAATMTINYIIDSTLGGFLSTVSFTAEINGASESDSCPVQFPPCSKTDTKVVNGTINKCLAGNPSTLCNTLRITFIAIGGQITGNMTIVPLAHP